MQPKPSNAGVIHAPTTREPHHYSTNPSYNVLTQECSGKYEGVVMSDRFYLTTAIDYPNGRPHIGTAFEKLGADVQARYRRMQGKEVFFLMGNDENTIKVAKRAAELGMDPKVYCDEMAKQFRQVWDSLGISYDDFIQTSEPRHHAACRAFIQRVYDNGYIYKGQYEGLYSEGSETYVTEKELVNGIYPGDSKPPIRRVEECYYFRLSAFQDRLLRFYDERPDFIQPETRRNEIVQFVRDGLRDVNITRLDQTWGIRVPFDERFTIYVWFDALLNYITAVGYAADEARFAKWWPADIHFIGKDITRFHCALWPAMCFAAGIEPPRLVFGHGFVQRRNEETGEVQKIGKSLGNAVEPMEIITKFSAEAFRYYFMRECPFGGDGEFSWQRFTDVYNSDLANNLGNLYSRVVRLIAANYEGAVLPDTAGRTPGPIGEPGGFAEAVHTAKAHVEACRYNQALETIWRQVLDPANQYADRKEPWKIVKTDKTAACDVLYDLVEPLRVAAILLKPFLPQATETIYRSFNFVKPWEQVRYEDAAQADPAGQDLAVVAPLEAGKPKILFPRIDVRSEGGKK
jgi:methionyl-tRNA synthetase